MLLLFVLLKAIEEFDFIDLTLITFEPFLLHLVFPKVVQILLESYKIYQFNFII